MFLVEDDHPRVLVGCRGWLLELGWKRKPRHGVFGAIRGLENGRGAADERLRAAVQTCWRGVRLPPEHVLVVCLVGVVWRRRLAAIRGTLWHMCNHRHLRGGV